MVKNDTVWREGRGRAKQTKCSFFRNCALKDAPMPPMSRIGPDECYKREFP